ncbi:hypothetical protein [Desulfogranum marinum]|nr:hypothetical protein [Desulfogranum marinum]
MNRSIITADREKVDTSLIIGGGLVLVGQLLINRRQHQRPLHD